MSDSQSKFHLKSQQLSQQLIIQKYGGATLSNPEKIKQVALRIAETKNQNKNIVAIVSAMGETTNQLLALANQVSKNPSPRELDMLLSVGERTSMALLTMALNDVGCEAISFTGSQAGILTDDSHIDANIIDVKAFRVSEALQKNKVVILAGFQGVSPITKEITTLGRGGSDTTAVAMAAHLNASHCEILKDVDSIFTADPKVVTGAKPIHQLNYEQLIEMTLLGAKFLHSKSASMAKEKNVKIYVGPAEHKNTEGSWISNEYTSKENKPLAINSSSSISKINSENLCSVSLTMTQKMTDEIKNKILAVLKNSSIEVQNTTETLLSFEVSITKKNKAKAVILLHSLIY